MAGVTANTVPHLHPVEREKPWAVDAGDEIFSGDAGAATAAMRMTRRVEKKDGRVRANPKRKDKKQRRETRDAKKALPEKKEKVVGRRLTKLFSKGVGGLSDCTAVGGDETFGLSHESR